MRNKRGMATQLMVMIVMAIVLISLVFFGFIIQLVGAPLQSTLQDTNGILQETFQSTGDQNIIDAGQHSFGNASASLSNLEWFAYVMFIVMFLVFIIMCFYVRMYPFLAFFWIILVVLMFFGSIYLTVVYQDLRVSPGLDTYYQGWENTDFMLQYLPAIILIVGIIGGIVMFLIATRSQEVELANYGGYAI